MSSPTIRVALVPNDLRSYAQCFPANSNCTSPGFVVEYWRYLGQLLHFTPQFLAADGFGDSQPASTNKTLFGMLIHNVADVTGPEILYNDEPLKYGMTVGPPFGFAAQVILFNQDHTKQSVRSGLPLDYSTTMLLTLGLMICHTIHMIINWYTSKRNLNWPISREMSMLSDTMAWIFLNIYLSVFVSQLAILFYEAPKAELPFENFPQLLDLVQAGSWKLIYVRNNLNEAQIKSRLRYSDADMATNQNLIAIDHITQLNAAISGKKFVAYVDSTLLFDSLNPPCDITWITDPFTPAMPMGFYYRKDFSKKFRLNYTETKITADIFEHMKREYKRKAPIRECGMATLRFVEALSIEQTSAIFIVLAAGLAFSGLSFGIEKKMLLLKKWGFYLEDHCCCICCHHRKIGA